MKKKYIKPTLSKVKIDNQISLVMMTEGAPPQGPAFGEMNNENKTNPYKA